MFAKGSMAFFLRGSFETKEKNRLFAASDNKVIIKEP